MTRPASAGGRLSTPKGVTANGCEALGPKGTSRDGGLPASPITEPILAEKFVRLFGQSAKISPDLVECADDQIDILIAQVIDAHPEAQVS